MRRLVALAASNGVYLIAKVDVAAVDLVRVDSDERPVCLVHLLNLSGVPPKLDHIVVELGQVGCCRQLWAGDVAEGMEAGHIVERLEELIGQPSNAQPGHSLNVRDVGQRPASSI